MEGKKRVKRTVLLRGTCTRYPTAQINNMCKKRGMDFVSFVL